MIEPELVGRRYVIAESLGSGGMGTVYRAWDRLNVRDVALKRVSLRSSNHSFTSRSNESDFNLALAREFGTLSSLRHPNIISVLDYGFDDNQQPYFTMELLEDSKEFLEDAGNLDFEEKIGYIVQVLQALAYLHRRGILHRDLKPANLLITDGRVKALDFGLSVVYSDGKDKPGEAAAGTVPYMAPEQLRGASATKTTDLYAVGVIAYELLAGRYPFDQASIAALMSDIVAKKPDLSALKAPNEVADVIEKLLAKAPGDRYSDCFHVIDAISVASGLPIPEETVELRESFLGAARFVGRDQEMERLSIALHGTLDGRGRLLLIAGESGVGKTRLVEEFRSQALVQGAYVIRGQAIDSGRRTYQLWRSAIKAFASLTQISPEKAGILKQIVPDIEDVLQIRVVSPPILDPREARELLVSTVVELVTKEELPLVFLLEDLQWMGNESLTLLQDLGRAIGEHRILIVGTYRNDERPELPRELPAASVLDLPRLQDQAMAELSRSILGSRGEMPEIVEFLGKQTEGNPFFIVEMVRALAEESGRLSEVGEKPIPEEILPGGVKQIIDRRIGRVPQQYLPLLELAAIAGREIDFQLMAKLSPESNLDAWRLACSESATLEITGEVWRFAHDKLRERLLSRMDSQRSQDASRQVAKSIESLYPQVPDEAARLAHLWGLAGDEVRQIEYFIAAGDHARFQYAFVESIHHYNQAVNLLHKQGDVERVASLQMKMGQVHENAFEFEEAREVFSRAFQLWRQVVQHHKNPDLPSAPHPLRLGWGEPPSLDPLLSTEILSSGLAGQLYVGLCELTQSLDLMPALAEGWEILDAGRRYIFHLPADGRWSDGEPLIAGDIEYTFRRLLDPAHKAFDESRFNAIVGTEQYWESEGKNSEQLGVRATGPLTVEIELEEAIGGYLYELASVTPIPKHAVEQDPEHWASGERLVCNGPYRIGSWKPGVSMDLVRNPYYSGRYRGNVEAVHVDFLPSESIWEEWVIRYENNEIDLAFLSGLTGTTREKVRLRYESEFTFLDERGTVHVSFDCSRPPFDNPNIRQAFAMALDKERFAAEFGWEGFAALGGIIPPSLPGHAPGLGLPFDPVQAFGLLDNSDSNEALRERILLLRGYANSERELAFLQAQWSTHLGVEIRTETLDWLQYLESLHSDLPSMHYIGSEGFPAEAMLRSVLEGGASRETWGNRDFDQSLTEARKARDSFQRLQLIQEADKMIIEEAPVIPLFYLPLICLVKPWITSLPSSHSGFWSFRDTVLEPH